MLEKHACTTGKPEDAECQEHWAKAQKHSAKCSPSVALGVAHSGNKDSAKAASPSVKPRGARRLFPECYI